jgi:hypothetical protein
LHDRKSFLLLRPGEQAHKEASYVSDLDESNGLTIVIESRRQVVGLLAELSDPRIVELNLIDTDRIISVLQTALLAFAAANDIKCTADGKEPVDLHTRPEGPDGEMIMRCEHDPSHCYSYGEGHRISCPV